MKLHSQVVRNLSTHGHDDTARLLQVDNVEHTFEGELVEVETVAHVVVRRNGFGVIVNHDGLITQLTGSLDGVHRAPVKLNGRTDAVSARAKYNH